VLLALVGILIAISYMILQTTWQQHSPQNGLKMEPNRQYRTAARCSPCGAWQGVTMFSSTHPEIPQKQNTNGFNRFKHSIDQVVGCFTTAVARYAEEEHLRRLPQLPKASDSNVSKDAEKAVG
jgi:hypothetical protein